MKQELINRIEELHHAVNAFARTFLCEIRYNDMDADQWALLQEGLNKINIKSQEAFLIAVDLRKEKE